MRRPDLVKFKTAWIERYELDPQELLQLQFYLGDEIEMSRSVPSGFTGRGIENHRLVVRDGTYTEVVTFPKHTPCVLRRIDEDEAGRAVWQMQFEAVEGFDEPYLGFLSHLGEVRYGVLFNSGSGLYTSHAGVYLDQRYTLKIGRNGALNYTELLIAKEALKKHELDSREVEGMRVGGSTEATRN